MPDPIKPVTAGDVVMVSRETFNRMAAILNWINKLAVAPPLMLRDGAAGPVISISPPADEIFLVKLTDVATYVTQGYYKGVVWLADTSGYDFDPSMDLTEAMLGTAGPDCLIIYPTEIGASDKYLSLSTSPLASPRLFSAIREWTQADGTPVMRIIGDQSALCT